MRLLALLVFAATIGYSQEVVSPTSMLTQGFVYQWTGENGLISNNITSAIQSSDGFMWITTYNGIMRFDGKRIMVYDRSNVPFLSTDAFYRAYEDTRGRLWFASQGSGIVLYENKRFRELKVATGPTLPKSVRSLLIRDAHVWIGSNQEGLFRLDTANNLVPIPHPQLNSIGILDLAQDSKGVLWIATDGNGLLSYDGATFKEYTTEDGLLSNTINSVAVTSTDEVYIGTTNGLNTLHNNRVGVIDFLKQVPINDLNIDDTGKKWIATENGLARISADDRITEFATRKSGFPYTRLNAISRDAEGSVWISTGRDGLLQLRETGIINITEGQKLASDRINIIVEGLNDKFFIGSDIGTIDVYSHGEITPLKFTTSLNEAGIRDVCEEADGTLWIASYKGILRIRGKQERLLTESDGLSASDMRRILKDKFGNLWFASRSGGLTKYSSSTNRVLEIYDRKNGLSSNYILSLEDDAQGNLYVGTHSGGLSIISPNGKVTTHHLAQDDAGVLIFNIHVESPDSIWLVCNTGPHFFDGKTFKKIVLASSTKGETHFDWLMDNQKNVWITSNLGVLHIKRNQLLQFLRGEIQGVPARLFDNQDGMQNKECTGATRALTSSKGKLWIPTIGGVSVFFPEEIRENVLPPTVFVTDLVTDDGTLVEDTVVIEPGNFRYVFNYTALSYLAPSRIRFRYQLSNVDEGWFEAGTKREAEYTNLPPGTYTFRVLASNGGVWTTEGAEKTIIVRPFFYQTAWFILSCVVVAILVLYFLYRWRVYVVERRNAELRKLNSELDRFVYSASHDLRAPLASILGLVTVARMDTNSNKLEYLDLIEKSIQKLDGFIHDIIDFSRNSRTELHPELIAFEPLVRELIEELNYMEEKVVMTKDIKVVGMGNFYTDKKRLAIILRNLISNAYKYHNPHIKDNFLRIHVDYNHQRAKILLSDNGIGISAEHLPNIFKMFYRGNEDNKGSGLGLYIVKEVAEKLRGTVTVHSQLEKGTEFTLIIPSLISEYKSNS